MANEKGILHSEYLAQFLDDESSTVTHKRIFYKNSLLMKYFNFIKEKKVTKREN